MAIAAMRLTAKAKSADLKRSSSDAAYPVGSRNATSLGRLQRMVGNRAMQSLLLSPIIQPKRTVSQPGNEYEREADRVADQVMRMPAPQSYVTSHHTQPAIQRVCTECEDKLQRQLAEPEELESNGDDVLCEGAEFPPAIVWFSDPMLARIRADEALMRFGSNGEPVVLVQQAVVAWGCDEGLGHLLPKFGVDGLFRSETRAAVKTFQREQGIEDDGIVGPITMSELDRFIPGGLPPCPSGTEAAAFVGESEAEPEQTLCQPPETPPLKQTKACPECTGKDFEPPPPYPPTTATAEVGDICRAEKCAPAHPHGQKGHICLTEGDQVKVLKRFVAELKQEGGGPKRRDAWLTVEVLDGIHKGKGKDKKVNIRERFVKDCAKPDCGKVDSIVKTGEFISGNPVFFFGFQSGPSLRIDFTNFDSVPAEVVIVDSKAARTDRVVIDPSPPSVSFLANAIATPCTGEQGVSWDLSLSNPSKNRRPVQFIILSNWLPGDSPCCDKGK